MIKLPLLVIGTTLAIMTYNLTTHAEEYELSPEEQAYNCLADQAYYPDSFADVLDLIAMCNATMDDYLSIYYDELEPMEDDYEY